MGAMLFLVGLAGVTVYALYGMWKSAISVFRDDIMVGFKIVCGFLATMMTVMFVLLFWHLFDWVEVIVG